MGTIPNRTADTFISTGESHSGNVYLHSGINSTGNVYIGCNNYAIPSGFSTTGINIGGASISTRYNGTVNICAFSPSSGVNNLNLGSNKTINTIQGSALILNSTNSTSNTIALGSDQTTSNTILGGNLYLNNTNGISNNVYVGGSNTVISDIRGSDVNVNSTYLATNTIEIGSSFSTNTILGTTNINTTGTADVSIGGSGGDCSITSAAGVTLNGGIKLGGSNFTNNIRVAFGRQTTTPGTGSPGLSGNQTVSFGVTFGANPFVFCQIIKNTYGGGAGQMCIGLDSVSTTQFVFNVRNNSNTGAPANSYYVNWFAIGQYS